jgi:predicted ATPase
MMSIPRFGRSNSARPVALHIARWRQFDEIDVDLHPHLSVIVGPNGTGKSTLLSLLSLLLEPPDGAGEVELTSEFRPIGDIQLTNGSHVFLGDRERESEQVLIGRSAEPLLVGSFHQATTLLFGRADKSLRSLIPVGGSSGTRAYVVAKHIVAFVSAYGPRQSLLGRLLRQWDNWSLFSAQASSMIRLPRRVRPRSCRPRLRLLLPDTRTRTNSWTKRSAKVHRRSAFSSALRASLSRSPGAVRHYQRRGSRRALMATTRTGPFSFDGLSHGLALIGMLVWDCVLLDALVGQGLMSIDEPENHLHPGLQRSLLATLVREFPGIQFVVATHSPFFVGAGRESMVCLLAYGQDGRVTSRMLRDEELDRAGTANDILREALETTTSRPLWLEDELRSRVRKYASSKPGRDVVAAMHNELKQQGQADLLPDAVCVLKQLQDEQISR